MSTSRKEQHFDFMHRWVADPDHPAKERKTDGSFRTGAVLTADGAVGLSRHTVIAFDGENSYSIYFGFGQGGRVDCLMVESQVDGPLKSTHRQVDKFDLQHMLVREWLFAMPLGLREKLVQMTAGKPTWGYFGELMEQAKEGIAKPQRLVF